MKKETSPAPLTESEREELIRLRAEVEYMKAENEVIKKEIALREQNRLRDSRRKSSDCQRTPQARIQIKAPVKGYTTIKIHLLL